MQPKDIIRQATLEYQAEVERQAIDEQKRKLRKRAGRPFGRTWPT